LDDRDAADQLREPLLQLLAVVVGRCPRSARAAATRPRSPAATAALDHRRRVLADDDLLRAAEIGDVDAFQFDAEILGDGAAAGRHGDA
jgi:hypothetical protein